MSFADTSTIKLTQHLQRSHRLDMWLFLRANPTGTDCTEHCNLYRLLAALPVTNDFESLVTFSCKFSKRIRMVPDRKIWTAKQWATGFFDGVIHRQIRVQWTVYFTALSPADLWSINHVKPCLEPPKTPLVECKSATAKRSSSPFSPFRPCRNFLEVLVLLGESRP